MLDENLRDIYNRFGVDHLDFDPRKDELQLVADVSIEFLFWGMIVYVMTLTTGGRASRSWIAVAGIVLLIVEVLFLMTESIIPNWLPHTLTEYELLFYLRTGFVFVIALLTILSELVYVDVDHTATAVLKEIFEHQKVSSYF